MRIGNREMTAGRTSDLRLSAARLSSVAGLMQPSHRQEGENIEALSFIVSVKDNDVSGLRRQCYVIAMRNPILIPVRHLEHKRDVSLNRLFDLASCHAVNVPICDVPSTDLGCD